MIPMLTPIPQGTPMNERFTTRMQDVWNANPEYPVTRMLAIVEDRIHRVAQSQIWTIYQFEDGTQIRVRLDGNVVECFDLHLVV